MHGTRRQKVHLGHRRRGRDGSRGGSGLRLLLQRLQMGADLDRVARGDMRRNCIEVGMAMGTGRGMQGQRMLKAPVLVGRPV